MTREIGGKDVETKRVLKDNGATALVRVFAYTSKGALRGHKDVELPTKRATLDQFVKALGGPEQVMRLARTQKYVEIRASIGAKQASDKSNGSIV